MNISDFDLNLLKVFVAVLEEGNITKAAEKVGLSQPAMSHALKRLRENFNDQLFVRESRGVTATPFAKSIEKDVFLTITKIQELYTSINGKELTEYDEIIRIGATDYLESIILPQINSSLESIFPKVTLLTKNNSGQFPKEMLEKGTLDLAIAGYFKKLPEGYFQQKLFEDEFVTVACPKNKVINGKLSVSKFTKCPHVLTTIQGDLQGIVDRELKKQSKERKIRFACSNFLSPFTLIKNTDLIFTCLKRMAETMAPKFDLIIHPVPLKLPMVSIVQVWHERTHQDLLRRSIRSEIKKKFS